MAGEKTSQDASEELFVTTEMRMKTRTRVQTRGRGQRRLRSSKAGESKGLGTNSVAEEESRLSPGPWASGGKTGGRF